MEVRHLIITGLVQGVGFRYPHGRAGAMRWASTAGCATAATAASRRWSPATPEQVAAMIDWARRGPPAERSITSPSNLAVAMFSRFELRLSV